MPAKTAKPRRHLSARAEAFCRAMADPQHPTMVEAYHAAGFVPSRHSTKRVSELAARPDVVARIAELRAEVAKPALMAATDVLNAWIELWTADPAELVRPVRYCCRHCYGVEHLRQWIDRTEFAQALAAVMDANTGVTAKHRRGLPTDEGGYGYDRTRPPVAGCYACQGEGVVDVHIADLSTVSPRARRLYAGAKRTKYGIEILMHDQTAALTNVAKYLGMFVERHRHGGDPDNPTPVPMAALPPGMDPVEASRVYGAIVAA